MKPGVDYVGITTPFYCHDGNGRILLHKRSKNCRDEQGRWDPGGGQLHVGEHPEEGVLREVMEEYGCKGVIDEQLEPYSAIREHEGVQTHWLALPFIVRVNPAEVRNNEPEAIDEIGWFRLGKFPNPLHTAFQLALERDKSHFDKYLNL